MALRLAPRGNHAVGEEPVVLFAEDEVLLRGDVTAALQEAGFVVIAATNGTEAKALLQEHAGSLRAFVTDVNLGAGPDGWDLGHLARELNPDLPVIYASGGTEQEWASKGVPNSLFIGKPYATAQIIVAVSTLMNAAKSS
jgi:two-component system cell cycle response regulator CpdR